MSTTDDSTVVSRHGLTAEQVADRVRSGQVNIQPPGPERTLAHIVRANVLTWVNGIMLFLFVLVMSAGHWRDGLFVGVVVSNSLVGIVQEVRARRELARLQVVNETQAVVIRDGERTEVDVEAIVLDDLLHLEPGHQVVVDGAVIDGRGLEIDESLLTGESVPVHKTEGDEVRSGSFVAAGTGTYRAVRVGADSYATRLADEARQFSLGNSELRRSIDRVLRWLLIIIPFASILLLVSLLASEDRWQEALQGTVAAAVAMVPDGLVLLTSLAFVAGVIELTRRKALAKQLSAVEVLARVDVLCLDKTGTITTGDIELVRVDALDDNDPDELRGVLWSMVAADPAPNATLRAIGSGRPDDGVAGEWTARAVEPFSSERKWSAVSFDAGTFHLGAPEVLLAAGDPVLESIRSETGEGQRVLVLVRSRPGTEPAIAPVEGDAVALVILADTIRADAAETLAYFRRQGVALKVISGDHPGTVAAIAERAGLTVTSPPVDARDLLELEGAALGEALDRATVFGRVAPHQKQAMVEALQGRGHVVAMTGDGVNDVLALKRADLGIAMGAGSPATRAVADIVLTDNAFSTFPLIVDQGRKVINNVERVANLFVTKVVYAVLLTLVIGFVDDPFPLLPRQLTLIGTFSIGVPGFFLAMAPELERVRPGFLPRVLRFSIPAGVAAGLATFVVYAIALRSPSVSIEEARTATTVTLLSIGLVVLAVVSRPLRPWKVALVSAMGLSYAVLVGAEFARSYFLLVVFPLWMWPVIAAAVASAGVVTVLAGMMVDRGRPSPAG